MLPLALIGIVVTLVVLAAMFYKLRFKPHCPSCGEPLNTKDISFLFALIVITGIYSLVAANIEETDFMLYPGGRAVATTTNWWGLHLVSEHELVLRNGVWYIEGQDSPCFIEDRED